MASNTNQVEKTLGEQMADLLRRKPKHFDVVFSVGRDKVKVEAIKFILKAASPVFEREFEENWENGVLTDDNGIPLPNFNAEAFQLFVNLIILDAWSLDYIKSLNLSPNNLLSLLGLCRIYEISKAIQNLEEAANAFILSFQKFKDTPQFLEISRDNLETIFSAEILPLDETEIFYCCCRWADNQCTTKGLEPTGENYREVLGSSLFQIRFPTMPTEQFTKVCLFKNNVLKGDEQLAIFLFIGLSSDQKTHYDKNRLPFKTNRRVGVKSNRSDSQKAQPNITTNPKEVNASSYSGCSVLSMPPQFKLTTSPSFVCDGSRHSTWFKVNEKISLHGIGFLGPIDGDANFDVTVQIKKCANWPSITFDSGTFKKNIFARKGKMFHFLLDEPIELESSTTYGSWWEYYLICFSLKGPNNISQYKEDSPKPESLEVSGVQFHLHWQWNGGNPLAELLFKNM